MKPKHKIKIASILFAIGAISLSSCCLKSINMHPQLSAVDLKSASAGTAKFDTEFTFKECCPGRKQKARALRLQERVGDLYDELLDGKVTLDDYNAKIAAAESALNRVILVCKATEKTENPVVEAISSITPKPPAASVASFIGGSGAQKFTEQDLETAWSDLDKVVDSL